jgi:hypothetical protein
MNEFALNHRAIRSQASRAQAEALSSLLASTARAFLRPFRRTHVA